MDSMQKTLKFPLDFETVDMLIYVLTTLVNASMIMN